MGARKTRAAAISTAREARVPARKEYIARRETRSQPYFLTTRRFLFHFSRMLLDKLLSDIAGTRNQVSQNEGGNI